jgi:hypothetical protein
MFHFWYSIWQLPLSQTHDPLPLLPASTSWVAVVTSTHHHTLFGIVLLPLVINFCFKLYCILELQYMCYLY